MMAPNMARQFFERHEAEHGARRIFFIGIGGVHMSALAVYSKQRGYAVSGSEREETERVVRLRQAGIPVYIGHDGIHVKGADIVVYTLAIPEDNPEYVAAREAGVPLFSRAEYLGLLMGDFRRRIGVAGSHGKSTVTAMLGEIFWRAGRAPNVFCGAPVRAFGESYFFGGGEDLIFEACEYRRSFLFFSPTLAVVLNTGHDHVDTYPTAPAAREAFSSFAALPEQRGTVLVNADDEGALSAGRKSPARCVTFGLGARADFRVEDVRYRMGRASFIPVTPTGKWERISLRVAGRHNLYNALAALAAARLSGLGEEEIAAGLTAFCGAGRRMEYKGLLCGARVYDDYAHHPEEIAATLGAARELLPVGGRLFVVFQSHTYSRTASFLGEIAAALRGADRVLIADIYAAREKDTLGMSKEVLAAAVGERALAPQGLAEITWILLSELSAGDVLVVMGAGDIDRIFGEFSPNHFTLP